MYRHRGRTSKHSGSIEHDFTSKLKPMSPPEFATKAKASMSFVKRGMFRSSRVIFWPRTSLASWWFWLSWTQWHSSKICENQFKNKQRKGWKGGNPSSISAGNEAGNGSVKCTFGPVRALPWHRLFNNFKMRPWRFLTQTWLPVSFSANWMRAGVQWLDARPQRNRLRESVKNVFWSDLVVQRVFRVKLSKRMSQNQYLSILI